MSDTGFNDRCNPLYDLENLGNGDSIAVTVEDHIHGNAVGSQSSTSSNDTKQSQDTTANEENSQDACDATLPSSPKIRNFNTPLLPHVDCPEKIVLCLDIGAEMGKNFFKAKAGEMHTALDIMKKSIAMFVKSKITLDKRTRFALVTLTDSAEWLCDLTGDVKELLYVLDSLQCGSSIDDDVPTPFSATSIYDVIHDKIDLPIVDGDRTVLPPPFILRVVLVYGRSHSLPEFTSSPSREILDASPYFYTDCLYLHEPLTEGSHCEEIYARLTSMDTTGLSYIFETARRPVKVYDHVAKLLAHPLQRVIQGDAYYKLRHASAEESER